MDLLVDADAGVVLEASSSVASLLGYTPEEIVGQKLTEFLPFRLALDGDVRSIRYGDIVLEAKDGTAVHVELTAERLGRAENRVLCTIREVRQSVAAADPLARDAAFLAQLLTAIPDNIYFKDRESRFIKVNEAMARWFGLADPAEAAGKTDADFFGAEHARQAFADEQRIMATGVPLVGIEEKETWPDGRVTWVSTSKVPIRDGSGRVVGLVGVSRDITEHKTLEEQALLSQKMEAIGRLAGGVAHDFNNLLGVIIGYGERVASRLPDEAPVHAEHMEVMKAAHRAAELTKQLLAFGRRQVLQPRVLDLNDVVSDMRSMLRRLLGEQFLFDAFLDDGLGKVWADPGQTGQILMNLVVNARDAMPNGGRLTVETKNVELDAVYAARHPPTQPGAYVMLAISDTGVGMDAETKAHVFEPFFTTKELGKGTGLGLATVYGIVKQSGGFVWLYSEPGVGTTIKVYLPRIDVQETAPTTEAARAPLMPGTETVLLVEDEVSLRNVVADTLQDNGYTVLMAGDGAEALLRANEHEGTIHLLLTDVIMPGMNGRETAQAAGAARPGMKVLYISGYTQEAISTHGELDHDVAFLSKPFTAATLLRRCRDVLDAPNAPPGRVPA